MAYQDRRPGGARQGGDRRDAPAPQLDTAGINLRGGENGVLDPTLFDTIAQRVATSLRGEGREPANKTAQVRQFYDELVMWEEKARQNPDRFEEFLPFIRMLNAKAAYAAGRRHVDSNFVDLIGHCVRQVESYETLRNFKLFFEAFLGFYKLERPSG